LDSPCDAAIPQRTVCSRIAGEEVSRREIVEMALQCPQVSGVLTPHLWTKERLRAGLCLRDSIPARPRQPALAVSPVGRSTHRQRCMCRRQHSGWKANRSRKHLPLGINPRSALTPSGFRASDNPVLRGSRTHSRRRSRKVSLLQRVTPRVMRVLCPGSNSRFAIIPDTLPELVFQVQPGRGSLSETRHPAVRVSAAS